MIDATRQALIETYIDAYNRFDIDGMLQLVSDDVRFEHHAGGDLSVATDGKADLEKLARVGAQLFSSRRQRIVEISDDGERVHATIDFHGEIAEDIPDGPGAGTIIEMQGTSEFAFSGGKISRIIDRA
jgi:steroid delta-isomerase-like uncharacterized protein